MLRPLARKPHLSPPDIRTFQVLTALLHLNGNGTRAVTALPHISRINASAKDLDRRWGNLACLIRKLDESSYLSVVEEGF